jgi:hypothetical protein
VSREEACLPDEILNASSGTHQAAHAHSKSHGIHVDVRVHLHSSAEEVFDANKRVSESIKWKQDSTEQERTRKGGKFEQLFIEREKG